MYNEKAKKFISQLATGELNQDEATEKLSDLLERAYLEGIDSFQQEEKYTLAQAAELIGIGYETCVKRFKAKRKRDSNFGTKSLGTNFAWMVNDAEIEILKNPPPVGRQSGWRKPKQKVTWPPQD